jgi:hypothetical protein
MPGRLIWGTALPSTRSWAWAPAALTLAAFAVAAALGAPEAMTGLLAAAAGLSLLHSATTARAAPTMFQIGRAHNTDAALAPLLARFARWSAARAALQTATLIVVAIAVAVGTQLLRGMTLVTGAHPRPERAASGQRRLKTAAR